MIKINRFFLIFLIITLVLSCDNAVKPSEIEICEYNIKYTAGSGTGESFTVQTVQGYHAILPNSELEYNIMRKGLSDFAGYYKQDFTFYGWADQDGKYYVYNQDESKNSVKFDKNVTLEALWRNDITGEFIAQSDLINFAVITDYVGNNEDTLIIPRVITLWEKTTHTDCLVTTIASGAVTDDSLKTVIIPDTVTEIKENAFVHCDNLKTVEIKSLDTTVTDKAFPSTIEKIQVPAEAEQNYKTKLPTISNKIEKKQNQTVVIKQAVTGVNLAPKQLSLKTGEVRKLTYSISPGNAANQAVSFTSSNPTTATVDAEGTVNAMASGTAVITVTTQDGNKTDVCNVTVVDTITSVTDISLDCSDIIITVGDNQTLVPTVYPANATDKRVTWTSSDTDIAKVDATGKVTGIKKGSTTITVTSVDGNFTTRCNVNVNAIRVTGVTLNKTSTTIDVSSYENLTCTVNPTDADDCSVKWTSSDTDIATVDANGKVSAIKVGTTLITVKTNDGGFTATCSVTVESGPAGFSVSSSFPSISGTISQQTSGTDIILTLTSTYTDLSYVWYVDNRIQNGETTNSITLEPYPWKRTVKCLFANTTCSSQATFDIAGTQFN